MPAVIPFIPYIIAGVGAVVGAVGAQKQAQSTADSQNYMAAVAKKNQDIANQYAQDQIAKGQVMEDQKRLATAEQISNVRAIAGASGFDLSSGTPLRLQSDTAKLGEVDALTIRNNAARAAYGYQVQGLNYGAQAQLDEMGASNALQAGQLNAFASIVGGASSVSSKWNSFKTAGGYTGPGLG